MAAVMRASGVFAQSGPQRSDAHPNFQTQGDKLVTTMNYKALLAATVLAWSASAMAQDYPNRPVTLVVPAVAGGLVDVIARSMADEMGKRLGQPVVVDNKPGAAGVLAAQTVARAKPDGYTLLLSFSSPITNSPQMLAKAPYDARRDFSYISQVCSGQLLLAVNAQNVPAKTMKEFVAWAGQNQGKVSYGSYGVGTVGHLLGAYLGHSRRLDMVHVAYKGEAPMVQDLVGGQIQWGIASAGTLQPQIESGRVRALAVLGDRRVKDLPGVPTMPEAGFADPEFKTIGWIGLMGPANLPAPVMQRLEKKGGAAPQATPMKARYQSYGLDLIASSSAVFRKDLEATLPLMEQLLRASGAKAE